MARGERKRDITEYQRRVRKQSFFWSTDYWQLTTDQRFVYDEWNVIMVLDGLSTNAITRKYSWGLDLSGTFHGAGGIGGLLAMEETIGTHQGSYWYFYDANGNVGQLVSATGNFAIAARYEYDAYGNALVAAGAYAAANPFRFSTKWFDAETGLYYYGYRYYSPGLGRWMSRDPFFEQGGTNLFGACMNDAIGRIDTLGLMSKRECRLWCHAMLTTCVVAWGETGAGAVACFSAYGACMRSCKTCPDHDCPPGEEPCNCSILSPCMTPDECDDFCFMGGS